MSRRISVCRRNARQLAHCLVGQDSASRLISVCRVTTLLRITLRAPANLLRARDHCSEEINVVGGAQSTSMKRLIPSWTLLPRYENRRVREMGLVVGGHDDPL